MPVFRYRSVEEMPRRWREPNDPENLRLVAWMLGFCRSFRRTARKPGVTRYRSWEEAEADRPDGWDRS
jgi:hypothetical protein